MLQVPPTGSQAVRPALKATQGEPADSGFPAMALLATTRPPAQAEAHTEVRQSVQDHSEDSEKNPVEPKAASVSQQIPDPGKPVEDRREATGEEETAASDPGPMAELQAGMNLVSSPPLTDPALLLVPAALASIQITPPSGPPIPGSAGFLVPDLNGQPTPLPTEPTGGVDPARNSRASEIPSGTFLVPPAKPEAPATVDMATPLQIPSNAAPAKAEVPNGRSSQAKETVPAEVANPASRLQAKELPMPLPAAAPEPKPQGGGESKPQVGADPAAAGSVPSPRLSARTPTVASQGFSAESAQAGSEFTAPAAIPRSQAAPNVRFTSPPSPARPVDLQPLARETTSTKETSKPVEPGRPIEKPQAPQQESSAGSDAPAGRQSGPGTNEPAPALARSESLGLQPTQAQPATPAAVPVNALAPKSPMTTWQAPVPAMLQQVENGIRWMLRNASPGAELQLHPEALGRVRIELKVEGGEVHARLWASDPKSIPVLQENKAFLEVSLKEQGLNLGSFDLRQHSNQAQHQLLDGQSKGQIWPTEARRPESGQDAPNSRTRTGLKARRVELIA